MEDDESVLGGLKAAEARKGNGVHRANVLASHSSHNRVLFEGAFATHGIGAMIPSLLRRADPVHAFVNVSAMRFWRTVADDLPALKE